MNDEDSITANGLEPVGVTERVMCLDEWTTRWDNNDIDFHRSRVNERLEKNIDAFEDGRENIRIFVPLCGKSVDIKWLADRGHTVVGVELSEMGVREFFEEQNLEYITIPVESINGTLYKSLDGKIRLYSGDFFAFSKNIEGDFNAIWDRGSLVAINRSDRERYSSIIKSLMAPDCHYMMAALSYNQSLYSGPPHSLPLENVVDLYGSVCTIEELEEADALKDKHRGWGLDWFTEKVLLLKLK